MFQWNLSPCLNAIVSLPAKDTWMGCFHPTQTAAGVCRESKPEAPPWSLLLTWLAQHTQGSSSSPSSQPGTAQQDWLHWSPCPSRSVLFYCSSAPWWWWQQLFRLRAASSASELLLLETKHLNLRSWYHQVVTSPSLRPCLLRGPGRGWGCPFAKLTRFPEPHLSHRLWTKPWWKG